MKCKYGLISDVDSSTIEKCFDEIFKTLNGELLRYTEVGLYNGRTTSGVKEYLDFNKIPHTQIGIDNFKDKEELVFFPSTAQLIQGSSIEVYNQLEDNSQHFIMIDGNHSLPYVIADFFCYKDKVKKGGFICFHDAAPHAQNVSYQRMGSDKDEDMYIAVLKALKRIGMIGEDNICNYYGFELAYHEWAEPEIDAGGGVIIFRKIK